jgi:hypothetical protein
MDVCKTHECVGIMIDVKGKGIGLAHDCSKWYRKCYASSMIDVGGKFCLHVDISLSIHMKRLVSKSER